MGLPSKFEWKRSLLLRGGYVRELAVASYPHIHGDGDNFSFDCRWCVRWTAASLKLTGVWLFGSVVRLSGLTRFELPPLSPASSEGSTGMVPIAMAIVAL